MNKFCTQCGADVADAQKFCNKCGARLTPTMPTEPAAATQPSQPPGTMPTRQYAQGPYQAPPPMSGQMPYQTGYPPAPQQPPFSQAGIGGVSPNLLGALCYLPILAVIFLLLDPYNKDRFIRFHAWQSIFYFVSLIAAMIGLGILNIVLPDILIGLVSGLVRLGYIIGWVWLMYQAYQHKMEKLPVIGDLAEQQVR